MPAKPLTHILVKPAGPDCNMACGYCFYAGKAALFGAAPKHRMSDAVQEAMIRQLMEQSGEQVSVTWQGGEPTLMGLDFFQRAVDLQQRFGRRQTVGNGIQTNGLRITEQWANFFGRYNFLVGLSLDGPARVHDHYRRMRGGQETWQRVADSARLMLERNVAVNALTVVNDHSVQYPRDIYDFHKETGLTYMQFIPCVEDDPDRPGHLAPFSVPAEAFGDFLCTIFDLWMDDFRGGMPTTSVRYFESLIYLYAGLAPPECTLGEKCGDYVVVEHNGDVFSCDFFVEPRWRLGNVMNGRLEAMLNGRRQKEFGRRKDELPLACRGCDWLGVCRGGCPKDRRATARRGNLNHLCPGMKVFFAHADPQLRRLGREARKRNGLPEIPEGATHAEMKTGRNAPCPCGSGKKFKRCCGRSQT